MTQQLDPKQVRGLKEELDTLDSMVKIKSIGANLSLDADGELSATGGGGGGGGTLYSTLGNNIDGALTQKASTDLLVHAKPDGVNDLISNDKITLGYLPDSVLGQVVYGGGFVPSTGVATLTTNAQEKLGTSDATITLTNDTTAITGYEANEGIYYIATASGTFASISFETGDWLVSLGTAWSKVDNTDAVTGVKGNEEANYRLGNVNITAQNVGAVTSSSTVTTSANSIQTLNDKNSSVFYPVTKTGAVYNADGSESLDTTITNVGLVLESKATISNDAGDANKVMLADGSKALVGTSNINDSAVTTAKLDSKAVTTAKIDDGAVTTAKIDDSAVTTAKIDSNAVTLGKIDVSTLTSTSGSLSNLPAHSGGTTRYTLRKNLNVVTVSSTSIWMNSFSASSWTQLGTIPEGYRPLDEYVSTIGVLYDGGTGQINGYARVEVTSAGNLQMRPSSTVSALSAITFSLAWFVA